MEELGCDELALVRPGKTVRLKDALAKERLMRLLQVRAFPQFQ